MKILLPYKHVHAIVGIPRSGTSIVNTIFNSFENAFSISEPLSGMFNSPNRVKNDKCEFNANTNPYFYAKELSDFLEKSEKYDLAGIKEVLSENNLEDFSISNFITSDYINFMTIVVRDPIRVFNSWFLCNWNNKYGQVEHLHKLYAFIEYIYSHIFNNYYPVYILDYEKLCSTDPKEYLNNLYDGYAKIEGEFKIYPSKQSLGDPRGLASSVIKKEDKPLCQQVLYKPNYEYIIKYVYPIYERLINAV